MHIRRLTVHRAELPLKEPWRTAYGAETSVATLFVRAESDAAEAWIEACPLRLPLYSPETATTAFALVRDVFAPAAVGRPLTTPADIAEPLAGYRGNSFAKAAVELCWWALQATETGQPLRRLFGGRDGPVRCGEGIGVSGSDTALLERITAIRGRGIERVKLKVASWADVERVATVREAFPELTVYVDCNGAFTLEDLPLFRRLDDLGVALIEQPLYWRDLADHAVLQRRLRQAAVCLDESITCARDARRALRLQACRSISIKPGRVGGLGEALRIAALCTEHGVGCWIGGMLESGLGTALNVELATLTDAAATHDIPLADRFYTEDTVTPRVEPCAPGRAAPAPGPFLGRRVLTDRIRAWTVERVEITG